MRTIDSLATYLDACIALRGQASDLWYRGIKDSSLSVSPGLYWRGLNKEWDLTSGFLAQRRPPAAALRCPLPSRNLYLPRP